MHQKVIVVQIILKHFLYVCWIKIYFIIFTNKAEQEEEKFEVNLCTWGSYNSMGYSNLMTARSYILKNINFKSIYPRRVKL